MEACSNSMITNFGKILTVVVFTTKLENADNGTDNKINFDLYHFLEMKIRELAQYHWYLVFKLNVSDFMSYKDPIKRIDKNTKV